MVSTANTKSGIDKLKVYSDYARNGGIVPKSNIDSLQKEIDSVYTANKEIDNQIETVGNHIVNVDKEIDNVTKNITIIKNNTDEKVNSITTIGNIELEQLFANRYN
jgi:peptidoglycan hydrolase CwlO-like protein